LVAAFFWVPAALATLLAVDGVFLYTKHVHSQGESHSHQEAIHKLEKEKGDLRRGIDHLEGSPHKWRRRKTPSEG
jgi:cell division protein FtsL